MKKTIGVIIFTKIGTKTSLLTGEFEFWNTFKKFNPNIDFVFIAISDFTRKSILNNRHLLNFPVSIIQVNNENELHKLNGLSGIFSYLTRNTFFGGSLDKACVMNYRISSYCTNDLKIPLFIRTPDSEYPYYDYKRMIDVRINGKTPSTPNFIASNQKELNLIGDQYIDYDRTYFIANGNAKLYDWVIDVTHNDIPEAMRIVTPDQARKNSIYVSDEFLFNVPIYSKKYEHFDTEVKINRLLFIGFIQGSVAKNRVKVLNKMFSKPVEDLPTDIIGPGAKDLIIDRKDVNLINKSVFGDTYFEMLNQYLAYIFIGKGNPVNKYINKTIWDCYSAKCPIVVYSPCDKNGLIFKNKEFYFESEEDLRSIYEKLQNPEVRNRWIEEQRAELRYVLDNIMDPMFSFDDYCEFKEADYTKTDLKLTNPLF